MGKRIFLLFLVLISTASLIGCVNQEEFESVNSQLEYANSENSELKSQIIQYESNKKEIEYENSALQSQVDSLSKELDDIKNGASYLLIDIKNNFENKNYSEVVSLSSTLHTKFNGSPEDIEAQELAKQSQTILDKEAADKKAKEEKEAAEAAKSAQDKAREVLRIYSAYISDIDSAGGVDVTIAWQNKSVNTVKYISFQVEAINAVGDNVSCEIRGSKYGNLQDTGPYATDEGDFNYSEYTNEYYGATWGEVWYNSTAKTVNIIKIEIEYTDGTKTTLSGNEIEYVLY